MSFSQNLKSLAQAEGSELKVLRVGWVGVGTNVNIENSFLQAIQHIYINKSGVFGIYTPLG